MVVGGWMSVDCALHIVELFAAEGLVFYAFGSYHCTSTFWSFRVQFGKLRM